MTAILPFPKQGRWLAFSQNMLWKKSATDNDSAYEKRHWDAANVIWLEASLKASEFSPTFLHPSGDVKKDKNYQENLQDSVRRLDLLMAHALFNVGRIDRERLTGDPPYPFDIIPPPPNNKCST